MMYSQLLCAMLLLFCNDALNTGEGNSMIGEPVAPQM